MMSFSNGYDFERYVLGISTKDRPFNDPINNNLDFIDELKKVKENQSDVRWDPKNPSTEISRKIFDLVSSFLGERKSDLRMFCSIGTLLDHCYGVDCFFVLKGRLFDSMLSVDLTTDLRKTKSKAEIIIRPGDLEEENLYQTARKIAAYLLETPSHPRDRKRFYFHKKVWR